MRLASGLTLLLAAAVSAQTDDHALSLLREVDSSARTTKIWRAQVVEVSELTGQGLHLREEIHVKIAAQSPLRTLHENTGDDLTRSVCDGADNFYSGDLHTFYRGKVTNGCTFPLADFYKLESNPVSATVIGRDRVQLAEGPRECEVVRAEWNRDRKTVSEHLGIVRTMCIDPVRRLILRDVTDSTATPSNIHSVKTTTFISYESNPIFGPDAFEFSVPTGAMQDDGPHGGFPEEPVSVNGIYRMGPRVSSPRLASKVEPSYTEEARAARLSGLVLVSLTVTQDGAPRNIKVVRGLGHGLDDKAIEAVDQWHFDPGMKDGVPVAVGPVTVAVSFHLP